MIIITGGTGWLGKTAIEFLIRKLDLKTFNKSVIVFGSKDKVIRVLDKNINVYSLKKINNLKFSEKEISIFHTAFLTKDKIQLLGQANYIKKNNEIINYLEKFIDKHPYAKIVYTSSGAVNNFLNNGDKENNIYGYLKLVEEKKLSKYGNCLVLRIYGLTGYYIHSPEVYALCDFISSALKNNYIKIKSNGKVLRSYVSAETLISFAFNWFNLKKPEGAIVNATNNKLDLLSLANNISNIIGNVKVFHEIKNDIIISDYSCDDELFNILLNKYNLKRLSIHEQL